eukprot:snap_masked-scaffold_58-processed-gene-0.62-mRNA-1 protein AED:1.00 eAED:1.00 QI:0/0/0/0/1/1/2/0/465
MFFKQYAEYLNLESIFYLRLKLSGPMFQKLGQWASTRADLFSESFRKTLSTLHDSVSSSNSLKRDKVYLLENLDLENKKFPVEINEEKTVFDSVDIKYLISVGSGVIANVYKTKLKNTRKEVVLKITKPEVSRKIYMDLDLLNMFSNFVHSMLPYQLQPFSIQAACMQFSTFMKLQLDLHIEAQNLSRFQSNFQNSRLKISFPTPLYVSKDGGVLIETYQEGITLSKLLSPSEKLNEIMNQPQNKNFKKKVARLGLNAFLEMVLVSNFTHSDLHPGNIIVTFKKHKETMKFANLDTKLELKELSLIDGGLVTELSPTDQENFLDLFSAVSRGKGDVAGSLMIERSRSELILASRESQEEFIKGIDYIVSHVAVSTFRLERVKIGDVLQDVLTLVYKHRIPIDPNFSTLVLSFVIAEGILRQLDGSLDIFKQSIPFLIRSNRNYKSLVIRKVAQSAIYSGEDIFSY